MSTCECGCGAEVRRRFVSGHHRRGKPSRLKHGHSTREKRTPEYFSWVCMRARCLSPSHKAYPRYGGKGVTVCPEWAASFEVFFSDMGVRPRGTSLDRIDGTQGYCPENCRWATAREQQGNMSTNLHTTINGVTKHAAEWARHLGISHQSFLYRLSHWPQERLLQAKGQQRVMRRATIDGRAPMDESSFDTASHSIPERLRA